MGWNQSKDQNAHPPAINMTISSISMEKTCWIAHVCHPVWANYHDHCQITTDHHRLWWTSEFCEEIIPLNSTFQVWDPGSIISRFEWDPPKAGRFWNVRRCFFSACLAWTQGSALDPNQRRAPWFPRIPCGMNPSTKVWLDPSNHAVGKIMWFPLKWITKCKISRSTHSPTILNCINYSTVRNTWQNCCWSALDSVRLTLFFTRCQG